MGNKNKGNGSLDYLSMLKTIDEKAENASNISILNSNFKSLTFSERLENAYKYDRAEVHLPQELGGDEVSEDLETLLKTVVLMELVGLFNTAKKLKKYIHKISLIKEIELEAFDFLSNEEARKIVSDSQSEKAKKPRSQYYLEVMDVIRLTWEKYPKASKTALLEALTVHYHGKVVRNTLYKWLNDSNLRPPKPEKYSNFELVFPQ
ncbi:hypothetical protein PAG57_11765 [Klebsiella quasipneumoniae]|uniref:hypothetical protein n=1 Tax=Klebsiella pneumoniae complex TaxID=3390273 RepID=UPI0025A2E697|nr:MULTISPECIES: hypothetical protein [Klebsiella]MDM7174590.1 hypothetical protein [Klebsiella variicola]MDR4547362.1 hypothetical protein [Klebsiella quasipneumoniae]WRP38256.1 hypothetical protein U1R81_03225 [Klebsiella variicola]